MITRERVRRVQEAAENLPPTPRSPQDEKVIDEYVEALVSNAFQFPWVDPPAALKKKARAILRKHPEPPIGEAVRLMIEEGRLGNDDRPMLQDERYLPVHVHPPNKHNDGLRTVVRKEEQAAPEGTRITNYRCIVDECRHGGLLWKRGQVFDDLARSRGLPEPDGPCWESFNPDYEECPMTERKIKVRFLP